MKFPWRAIAPGKKAPLLPVGVRRNGIVTGADLVLLVDTGADQTLFHLLWAEQMGFEDTDLVEEECKSASGPMIVYRPKNLRRTELEIGGAWYQLPSLQFGKKVPMSLLGRDMIFAHFDLRMTADDFDLIPHRRRISG